MSKFFEPIRTPQIVTDLTISGLIQRAQCHPSNRKADIENHSLIMWKVYGKMEVFGIDFNELVIIKNLN